MKKNLKTKTHNLYKIIFIFVVFLGIGYAFLEANLNINGDVTVEAPEFNTYIQSVSVTSGSTSGTPVIVGNDKKEVDFSTALTDNGSSFFEETTTLTNKGSAKAYIRNIDVKVYDSSDNEVTLSAPYEYSLTHGDGTPVAAGEELAVAGTQTYKLKFNYISGTDMNTVTDYPTYTFKIIYNFTKDIIILPAGKTKDTLTTGDEICIKGECFNFLHYEGTNDEDIVMLAKWNLKVGYIYNGRYEKTGEYTSTDPGYGLQSSEVLGYVSGSGRFNGIVHFSATNYWYDGSGLKTEYGSSYPTDVYDSTNYKIEPDFSTTCDNSTNCWKTPGYSIAYYVEEYKTLLTGYGATIKDARLLTYSEVTDSSIGCDSTNYSCPTNGFISNTSFWLGSAGWHDAVWTVGANGRFDSYTYSDYYFGVRPVIVLSKSNI